MSITTKAQAIVTSTGVALYARLGLAGAIGCGVSHGVFTPIGISVAFSINVLLGSCE